MNAEPDLIAKVRSFCEVHWRPLLALCLVLALILAWIGRWVNDDAFISFNYARALVRGEGLAWFGVKVEGYTNFLWVLWTALGLRLGFEPVNWSYFGGLIAFAVTLLATWDLSRRMFHDTLFAFIVLILLVTNYTMISFATSGLETMAQTALITLVFRQTLVMAQTEKPGAAAPLFISLLSAAALLTRLDSAVIIAVTGVWSIIILIRKRSPIAHFLALALPVLVIIGAWEAWRISYYGKLLPNTFYAKVAAGQDFNPNGIHFIIRFARRYLIWPFLLLGALIVVVKKPAAPLQRLAFPVIAGLLWAGYLIMAGGDFMEFRFMVPVLPLLFIVVAYAFYYVIGEALLRNVLAASLASVLILGAASHHHSRARHNFTSDYALDVIPELATFYGLYPDHQWNQVGIILKEALHDTGAILACHAVGAIPYYSELRTVDQWGLTDLEIPERGVPAPPSYKRPGHRRYATLDYLKQKQVNLIIGHPKAVDRGVLAKNFQQPLENDALRYFIFSAIPFIKKPPEKVTLVEAPMDEKRSILMWYLTPTPAIDQAIAQAGWTMKVIEFSE